MSNNNIRQNPRKRKVEWDNNNHKASKQIDKEDSANEMFLTAPAPSKNQANILNYW